METTAQTLDSTSAMKKTLEQVIKFILVGVMNTGVDLVILNLEMFFSNKAQGTAYTIQKAISFLFAVCFSYFINKYWTFQDNSKEGEKKKMSQFFAVSFVGMIINVTVASIVVNYFQAPIINMTHLQLDPKLWGTLGALCGTAIGLFWNFIGYKLWVFKK